MTNKLKAALIGGAALGALLVITVLTSSILRIAGCCGCLWPIGAGLLAGMIYIRSSPVPVRLGEGAVIGALAGLIGGLIYLVVGLPLTYFLHGVDRMEAQLRQLNPAFPISGIVLLVIGGLVGFVIYVVLTAVGGLIAVPIFEKRKDGAQSPPPPGYGN